MKPALTHASGLPPLATCVENTREIYHAIQDDIIKLQNYFSTSYSQVVIGYKNQKIEEEECEGEGGDIGGIERKIKLKKVTIRLGAWIEILKINVPITRKGFILAMKDNVWWGTHEIPVKRNTSPIS